MVYPYKRKTALMLTLIVVMTLNAVYLAYVSLGRSSGQILLDLGALVVSTDNMVHLALALGAAILDFYFIVALVNSFRVQQELVLTKESLISPKSGFNARKVEIPYSEIKKLKLERIRNMQILEIRSTRGNINVSDVSLGGIGAFNEVCEFLVEKSGKAITRIG